MKHGQAVEEAVGVHHVHGREQLPQVGEDVAVRQLDPLGHAFRAAGEQDDRRLAGRDAELRPAKREPVPEEHAQLGQAGAAFPDVLEVNELDAGRLHRCHVQLGLGQEHSGGNDLPQPGQLRAGEHQRHAAGVVEHSRDFADAPQGK